MGANPRRPLSRWLPLAGGVLLVLAMIIGLVLLARGLMLGKPQKAQRQVAQVVQLLRPPPPVEPPPPPPPEEEEKIEEPEPQDAPEPEAESAAAEQLGLDADGAAGGDGFGLAARRGGQDLVGKGSAMFVWYTTMLKETILDALSADETVRTGSYTVIVRLWLASDGRVERIALAQSTGRSSVDSAIERALTRVARVRDAPPLEMPQPVTLKIVSRG